MLTTLLRPTSGSLELDGLDPATHQTEVRRRFGVVFQDPSLDSDLTAWENMDIHGVLYHVPRQVRRGAGGAPAPPCRAAGRGRDPGEDGLPGPEPPPPR